MKLRPEQEKLAADAKAALLAGHKRVLCVLPTGGGKTNTFIEISRRAVAKGRKVLVLVHRKELLHQTRIRYLVAGLPIGEKQSIHISTIGRRTPFEPDLLIIDEAHHSVSKTWREKIEQYDVPVLGWTATPERLDGRGLHEIYQAMVIGPSVEELIALGRLSTYKLFAPPPPCDLSHLGMVAGDFNKKQAAAQVDNRRVLFDAVQNWQKYAPGRRTIAFCVSILHAVHTTEEFLKVGVKAEILDSTLNDTERLARVERFKSGETLMLVSVMLISEGFDVPACDCVLMLRPTASVSLYLQQVGRGLRPSDHPCIVIDCVGNSLRLGPPDMFREWSLDAPARKNQEETAPPIRICEKCFQAQPPRLKVCPHCGHVHVIQQLPPPETVAEDLVEVDVEEMKRQARREVGEARTREALEEIARQRGYKMSWVDRILAARGAR
jgi:superfamily II DNA or RNA helicase